MNGKVCVSYSVFHCRNLTPSRMSYCAGGDSAGIHRPIEPACGSEHFRLALHSPRIAFFAGYGELQQPFVSHEGDTRRRQAEREIIDLATKSEASLTLLKLPRATCLRRTRQLGAGCPRSGASAYTYGQHSALRSRGAFL